METKDQEQVNLRSLVLQLGVEKWSDVKKARDVLIKRGASSLTALKEGMSHADWRVRVGSTDLMDQMADQGCIPALKSALQDPVRKVRLRAMHSIACQRCKPEPLEFDMTGVLLDIMRFDPSLKMRRRAVGTLAGHPPDPRARKLLHRMLLEEEDPNLLQRVVKAYRVHYAAPMETGLVKNP